MSQNFCGLDFGTSNSTIGTWQKSKPSLVNLEGNNATLPSILFYSYAGEPPLFGRKASQAYLDGDDGRLLRSLKSVLGTSLMHEKTQIGMRRLSLKDILSTFIEKLKIKAETNVGASIEHVVLGRPVHFVDHDKTADKAAQTMLEDIAKNVGFKHVAFQYEPIAAAINYAQQTTKQKRAIVIDLGGGTSDFSVALLSADKQEVLSNTGIHIGGTDFDKNLSLSTALESFGYKQQNRNGIPYPTWLYHDLATWQKIPFLYKKDILNTVKGFITNTDNKKPVERLYALLESQQAHRLAMDVEAAKITLTDDDYTTLNLSYVETDFNINIARHELEETLADDLIKLRSTAKTAVNNAGLKLNDIDAVFLTGGSTAIPVVRHSLTNLFPQAEVVEGDMFGSVGLGLTQYAQKIFS